MSNRKKYKYYIGKKLGELELKGFLGKGLWVATCSCGNTLEVKSNHLYRRKSCGCKSKSNRFKPRPQKEVIFTKKIGHYRNKAKVRNLAFNLSKEEFIELILGNCYYCKISPCKPNLYREFTINLNGIDRLDSSMGYFISNCVSCCFICNRAKSDMNYNDFREWMQRVKLNA